MRRLVLFPASVLFLILPAMTALAVPVSSDQPYQEVWYYDGYIEYAGAWHVAPAGAECVAFDLLLSALKNCGGIRSGSSMDGEVHAAVTADVHTIIVELVYEPRHPANALQLDLLCPDVPRGGSGAVLDPDHPCYFATADDTYMRLRVDKSHWEDRGYTYVGNWAARVFASGSLGTQAATGVDAGLTIGQDFELAVSVFHDAPAPENHTAFE